ncbi:pilus assembly protein [Pararhodobacter sp.]|uniref:TadE/TadG family type IV pilus assembly protein n=1 Tax=Pararhodobacter sp. TaxID=2127056 RepID=UPI002AFF280E|nr:pilus assembly protein [Pararhodobacter sp.]
MTRIFSLIQRYRTQEAGTATIGFVIAVPLVLSILFTAIDFGAVMLRQVFLDRAVDISIREVRLGNVPSNGIATLRAAICARTILIGNCEASLTVELRPIDTQTWAGINDPVQCINRSANIAPTVVFNPSAGNQDLMLVRVCASADPFITFTGLVLGLGQATTGDFHIVSIGAFTNEPA